MSKQKEFRLSPLEEELLILLRGRELYGLEIIQGVKDASDGKRQIGFGSLYPTLHKMQKKGLVSSRWGDERPDEREGARRRYYTITGLGERALQEAERVRVNLAQWQPAWGKA